MFDAFIGFSHRLSAKWRWIVAGVVLLTVALAAYHQGWFLISVVVWVVSFFFLVYAWVAAAWPDDPGTARSTPDAGDGEPQRYSPHRRRGRPRVVGAGGCRCPARCTPGWPHTWWA